MSELIPASTSVSDPGRLYLVPAPLDFGCATEAPLTDVLPETSLRIAAGLRHWVCENAKSLRAYLKRIQALHPLVCSLQEMQIVELPRVVHKKGDHQGEFDARPLLEAARHGASMGLASEAGMPAIADPGSSVVRAAHLLGLEVVPLVGPMSLMLALAASGLHGQSFAFVGYLPQDAAARAKRLRELEGETQRSGQTQIFIETPYRNAVLLQALLQALDKNTRLSISAGLSLPSARSRSDSVAQWRQGGWTPDNQTPAVFLIGR